MSIIKELSAKPAKPSLVGLYTSLTGLFYMANGATMLVWPGIAQTIFAEPPFVGHEAGLARVIGMLLAILGWLYVFAGRAMDRPFIAAGAIDRIFLVPIVLIPLAIAGTFSHLLLIFAILDPLLGAGAWYLLTRPSA